LTQDAHPDSSRFRGPLSALPRPRPTVLIVGAGPLNSHHQLLTSAALAPPARTFAILGAGGDRRHLGTSFLYPGIRSYPTMHTLDTASSAVDRGSRSRRRVDPRSLRAPRASPAIDRKVPLRPPLVQRLLGRARKRWTGREPPTVAIRHDLLRLPPHELQRLLPLRRNASPTPIRGIESSGGKVRHPPALGPEEPDTRASGWW